MIGNRETVIAEFYGLLRILSDKVGGPRVLAQSAAASGWPPRGVYFFFEPGELRAHGEGLRVVRVGTHGLRPSRSTLWQRLSQHKGTSGGSRAGGGNHRGSIFRLHVGEALLARGDIAPEVGETWGRGSTAPRTVTDAELALERAVSERIGAMPLLWVGVDDEPGPSSDRAVIESGAISLLSNLGRDPIDPPSDSWLGRYSQRSAIRDSGLWNVQHVAEPFSEEFLPVLARHIEST